ncbi:hypothetical protein, partial [uncultured Muribaculum sp.]|uniref:hypothetical protein n=1 Tax=uncultured Muribaculum sp. TaxID=1918613 RepID=UPI002594E834
HIFIFAKVSNENLKLIALDSHHGLRLLSHYWRLFSFVVPTNGCDGSIVFQDRHDCHVRRDYWISTGELMR